jgi:Arc/MetJ-type ribon-helix-helix transcriptional regulator
MTVMTLKLPPQTARRLTQAAARRRVSKSAFVRELLESKLDRLRDEPTLSDLMQPTLGALDSGKSDLGHNPRHLEGFGRR